MNDVLKKTSQSLWNSDISFYFDKITGLCLVCDSYKMVCGIHPREPCDIACMKGFKTKLVCRSRSIRHLSQS